MNLKKRSRGLIAGFLLAAAWSWTSARVAAFQIRSEADKDFWSRNLGESLEKYRLLERFGPTKMKARAGQLEVYLSLSESPRRLRGGPMLSAGEVRSRFARVFQRQLAEEALRAETWSQLSDFFSVLKPQNQARRVYSLEEITRPPEERLEIEDLLSIRALEVSLALDPNGVYHRDTLADLEWGLGLRDLAKSQYGEVVTILPDPEKHLFLAPGKVSDELADVVVEALKRAAKPPRNAEPGTVYRHLGMFLMVQEKFQEAYDAFQTAQNVSGRNCASWKAMAESAQGHLDEAIELYREAMVSEPLEPENRFYVLVNMGDLLERQGRHREASEVFRSALLLKPRDPGTLLQLAQVNEAMGLWQEAEELYLRASEIGSDRIAALAQVVAFYRRIGRPSLALIPARKLLELEPDEPLYRRQIEDLEAERDSRRH